MGRVSDLMSTYCHLLPPTTTYYHLIPPTINQCHLLPPTTTYYHPLALTTTYYHLLPPTTLAWAAGGGWRIRCFSTSPTAEARVVRVVFAAGSASDARSGYFRPGLCSDARSGYFRFGLRQNSGNFRLQHGRRHQPAAHFDRRRRFSPQGAGPRPPNPAKM